MCLNPDRLTLLPICGRWTPKSIILSQLRLSNLCLSDPDESPDPSAPRNPGHFFHQGGQGTYLRCRQGTLA